MDDTYQNDIVSSQLPQTSLNTIRRRDRKHAATDALKEFKKRISASFGKLAVLKDGTVPKEEVREKSKYATETRSVSSNNLAAIDLHCLHDQDNSRIMSTSAYIDFSDRLGHPNPTSMARSHDNLHTRSAISGYHRDSAMNSSSTHSFHADVPINQKRPSVSSRSSSMQRDVCADSSVRQSTSSRLFKNFLRRPNSVKRHNSLGNILGTSLGVSKTSGPSQSTCQLPPSTTTSSSTSLTAQPPLSNKSRHWPLPQLRRSKKPQSQVHLLSVEELASQHVANTNHTYHHCRHTSTPVHTSLIPPPIAPSLPPSGAHKNRRPKSEGSLENGRIRFIEGGGMLDNCHKFGRHESYHKLEMLGEGSYASVYKGVSKLNNRTVALKEIKLQSDEGAPFTAIREASLLKGLRHSNIVTLHDIVHTKETLTFVFEYVQSDLSKYLERYPHGIKSHNVKLFLYQLLRGLAYCHTRKILHRDLKPQNLLISGTTGELKLADFGLARAKSVPSKTYSHEVVTLWYRPPDVLLGSTTYNGALDMWGVGCIFTEMISGVATFPGMKDAEDQLNKIFKTLGTPNESTWPGVTRLPHFTSLVTHRSVHRQRNLSHLVPRLLSMSEAESMAESLLVLRPELRLTAVQAMRHTYFHDLPPNLHQLDHCLPIFAHPDVHFEQDSPTTTFNNNNSTPTHEPLLDAPSEFSAPYNPNVRPKSSSAAISSSVNVGLTTSNLIFIHQPLSNNTMTTSVISNNSVSSSFSGPCGDSGNNNSYYHHGNLNKQAYRSGGTAPLACTELSLPTGGYTNTSSPSRSQGEMTSSAINNNTSSFK